MTVDLKFSTEVRRSSGSRAYNPRIGPGTRARNRYCGPRSTGTAADQQQDAGNGDRETDAVAEGEHAADHGRRRVARGQGRELRRVADHRHAPQQQPGQRTAAAGACSSHGAATQHSRWPAARRGPYVRCPSAAAATAAGEQPIAPAASTAKRPDGQPGRLSRRPGSRHQHPQRVQLPHVAEVAEREARNARRRSRPGCGRSARRRVVRPSAPARRSPAATSASAAHRQQHRLPGQSRAAPHAAACGKPCPAPARRPARRAPRPGRAVPPRGDLHAHRVDAGQKKAHEHAQRKPHPAAGGEERLAALHRAPSSAQPEHPRAAGAVRPPSAAQTPACRRRTRAAPTT